MYYKRWTRMHWIPALQIFHDKNVLANTYNPLRPLVYFSRGLDLYPRKWRLRENRKDTKMQKFDQKLMHNLFLKYPDLKYQSLDRAKSDNKTNTFSYAYSFLQEQKKYIRAGFSISRAFELAEKKFQEHINRKLDQTLLARGLAIGNKARSFLTVYQQQMEYESRLKTYRTKREVEKYEQKLNKIRDKIEDKDEQMYSRMLYNIKQNQLYDKSQRADLDNPDTVKQEQKIDARVQRQKFVKEFQTNVKSMFKQFYLRAAKKDRLDGLYDQQIKNQILSSPNKIKKNAAKLLKKLQKHGVVLKENGEVDYSAVKNERIKSVLMENENVKLALMLKDLDFELPHRIQLRQQARKLRDKLGQLEEQKKAYNLSKQDNQKILKNKKIAYEGFTSSQLRQQPAIYKIFETYEQRLLRIQIKWIRSQLADIEKSVDAKTYEQRVTQLTECIQKLRRIKYKVDQKHLQTTAQDVQELFVEHKLLGSDINIDSNVQYEALLNYLKKKSEQRRLSTYEQMNDNKINELSTRIIINEDPLPEGFKRFDKEQ